MKILIGCEESQNNGGDRMDDLISRQAAIDAINHICPVDTEYDCTLLDRVDVRYVLSDLPSAQPTLYGYNMEHLVLIATILQKENLPPDRVGEAIADIGGIVSIVRAEFEEELQKSIERWMIEWEKR